MLAFLLPSALTMRMYIAPVRPSRLRLGPTMADRRLTEEMAKSQRAALEHLDELALEAPDLLILLLAPAVTGARAVLQ